MGQKRISDYANSTSIATTTEYLSELADGSYNAVTHAVLKYDVRNKGNVTNKISGYTITDTDGYDIITFSGASANGTIVLPTLADNQSRVIRIVNLDSTYELTVDGEGAETIEGCTTIELPKQYNFIELIGTSSTWLILDESISCQLRLNTYAGYGSTDNKIMRFTNSVENYGNCFSENHSTGYNSNADGLEITINKAGKYAMSFSTTAIAAGGSVSFGFSLNSTQLTTDILSITAANRLTVAVTTPSALQSIATSKYFSIGDVIRPHTDGGAAATTALVHFTIAYLGK